MSVDARTDAQFLGALRGSHASQWAVARWIWDRGNNEVIVSARRERPTAEERGDYADRDLFVNGYGIEVKQRPELDFKDAADFPYPTVIIDEKRKFDGMDPPPSMYVCVNNNLTCALAFDVRRTRARWDARELWDGTKQFGRLYYLCPVELAQVWKMGGGDDGAS